ncbi:MAG: hypothetical protein ACK5NF_00515 [Bacilli bacterium]
MERKIKKFLLFCSTVVLFISTVNIYAGYSLEVRKLYFSGYQDNTKVYSSINDQNIKDKYKYAVKATVYNGNYHGTGWKNDKAYKSANRVWWANESSYYDYYKR